MRFSNEKERELQAKIAEIACSLAQDGRQFNQHLRDQFKRWETVDLGQLGDLTAMPDEHLFFYKAVAQTLGWLQRTPVVKQPSRSGWEGQLSPLPPLYLQVILEARKGRTKNVRTRLDELIKAVQVKKLKRSEGVIAGVETWAGFGLPDVTDGSTLDLDEVQRCAIPPGTRALWTALAPIKMYAIHKGLGTSTPITVCPPIGRAVSRGIERLLGFTLVESRGDYELSRKLHLKLADLAKESIWDINSGLYLLGGGS